MDRKEREPNLIRLANWIWRVTSVIPGGQQVHKATSLPSAPEGDHLTHDASPSGTCPRAYDFREHPTQTDFALSRRKE